MKACQRVLLYLLLVLLGGCGSPLVRPNEAVKLKSFSLTSPVAWSQFSNGRERVWTIDGPALNRLWIIDGVKPGEQVFLRAREWGQRKGEGAVFQAGIASGEAIELIADGLRGFGIDNLQLSHSRPAKFGLLPGFAFDFQFDSRRGLRYSGFGAGELENDTLSFIVFFAPTEYYFERDRGNAQKTLDSIRNH